MINFIVLFDAISIIGAAASLFYLVKSRGKGLLPDIRIILSGVLFLYLLYSLFMIMEWSNITAIFDPNEDLIGALIPMMWAFLFYSLLLKISGRELRESKDRYRRLFEESSDLVFIHEAGRIVDVNRKTCEVLGYSKEQLLSMTIPDLHLESEREMSVERIKNQNRSGSDLFFTTMVKANGDAIYLEVSSSLIDPQNNLCQGIARDVTERKKAEERLVESENKYRLLAENSSDIIFTFDLDLNYTYVSPAVERIRGFTSKEVMAGGIEKTLTPDSMDRIKAALDEELKKFREYPGNKSVNRILEIEAYRKDGSIIFGETSLSFIFDENGNPCGIQGVTRDITERRKAEEEKEKLEAQLRQSQKMEAIGTLAGGIAHDFNNILSIIFGYTDLAFMDLDKPDMVNKDLDNIKIAAMRARDLTGQILTLSRQTEQKKTVMRFSHALKEALKLLKSTIPSTIEISRNIESESMILADPTQLHQIIMNLATNAYHAMLEKGGVMHFSLKDIEIKKGDDIAGMTMSPGKYLCLEVSDTGCGMDSPTREKIFDPYYTTKETGAGTGLGLAVVHGIVEGQGGKISITSEPGVGTSFFIYLPAFDGSTERKSGDEKNEDTKRLSGDEFVMYVDDEEQVIGFVERFMSEYGYRVRVFSNSEKALEAFSAKPDQYDIVVTDMTMPRMNGLDLSNEIRKIRPDFPVIICSGYNHLLKEKDLEDMGLNYMPKPIVMSRLIKAVRKVLDSKKHAL